MPDRDEQLAACGRRAAELEVLVNAVREIRFVDGRGFCNICGVADKHAPGCPAVAVLRALEALEGESDA